METKEMKAVISKKFRKRMLIAFIVYEVTILLLGILGFILGYKYRDATWYSLDWWFFVDMMPIEKIDNIAAVNSAFYWFTGKTIRIASTSGVIKIPFVVNADEVVAFLSEAIEKAKNRPVKAVAEQEKPQGDIVDSLKKLAELRNAGIITEEEFNQKKNELLGKM